MDERNNFKQRKTGSEDIGRRLDELRRHLELSKAALADLLGFKHVNSISHLLNGTRNLTIHHLHLLLEACPELNLAWLLSGDENMLMDTNALRKRIEELTVENASLHKQVGGLDRERKILFGMTEALTRRYILGENPADILNDLSLGDDSPVP